MLNKTYLLKFHVEMFVILTLKYDDASHNYNINVFAVQSTRLVTLHSLWPTKVDTGKWSSISPSLITVIQQVISIFFHGCEVGFIVTIIYTLNCTIIVYYWRFFILQ